MFFRLVMKGAVAAGFLAVLLVAAGPVHADWGDDFNDGVIDDTKWLTGVSNPSEIQVVEENGYLKFDRHTGSGHYAMAGAFGKIAETLGDEQLVVEFDVLHGGDSYSNYARVMITPSQITDPDDYFSHQRPDSIQFQTSPGNNKFWFRQYYGGELVGDGLTCDGYSDGAFQVVLERTDTGAYTSVKWYDPMQTQFVTLGGFDVYPDLVSDQYYVNLTQEAYRVATVEWDYVDVGGGGTPSPIPGDANLDNVVNDADASILAAHWQQTSMGWGDGDFNGDTVVNDADASILAAHWQESQEGAVAVPEPGAAVLLLGGLLSLLVWRRRR